jgi:hypothetical protein
MENHYEEQLRRAELPESRKNVLAFIVKNENEYDERMSQAGWERIGQTPVKDGLLGVFYRRTKNK